MWIRTLSGKIIYINHEIYPNKHHLNRLIYKLKYGIELPKK